MHHRKASEVVGRRVRLAGDDVGIDLRPSQPENGADGAHQPIFDFDQLGGLLGALAVNHDQCLLIGGKRSVIVATAESGVREACGRILRRRPEEHR